MIGRQNLTQSRPPLPPAAACGFSRPPVTEWQLDRDLTCHSFTVSCLPSASSWSPKAKLRLVIVSVITVPLGPGPPVTRDSVRVTAGTGAMNSWVAESRVTRAWVTSLPRPHRQRGPGSGWPGPGPRHLAAVTSACPGASGSGWSLPVTTAGVTVKSRPGARHARVRAPMPPRPVSGRDRRPYEHDSPSESASSDPGHIPGRARIAGDRHCHLLQHQQIDC